jgi:hypothetical protein
MALFRLLFVLVVLLLLVVAGVSDVGAYVVFSSSLLVLSGR